MEMKRVVMMLWLEEMMKRAVSKEREGEGEEV